MKKLGEGISGVVYTDGEYAYKRYREGYSLDNMVFETQVQNEIYENTDSLPCGLRPDFVGCDDREKGEG